MPEPTSSTRSVPSTEEIRQSDGGLPLTAMKLVDRSEVIRRQLVDVLPACFSGEDYLAEILAV
jgi:hypothetical protein